MPYIRKTVDKRKHNLLIMLLTITVSVLVYQSLGIMADEINAKPIHPLADVVEVEKHTIEYVVPETIEDEIRAVFGEHADDALKVLSCENRGLRPDATNDNRTWGGVGVDHGIFQINDYWQGFRHEGKAKQFLQDPAINIRVAWRIYEDNGYSFSRWTCGRMLGL